MSDAASVLYPSMAGPAPAEAPAATPAAPAPPASAPGAAAPPAAAASPTTESTAAVAASLYPLAPDMLPVEMPKTYEAARWSGEPAASSTVDYNHFVLNEASEGQHVADAAMHTQALDAMQTAGLGVTQARFFYDLARDAATNPPTTDRATAEAQLHQVWGAQFDANLAAVTGLVDEAQKAWPGVREYLRTSGLGNDPRFLIAAARKAARQ